jgi:hypothetical protein
MGNLQHLSLFWENSYIIAGPLFGEDFHALLECTLAGTSSTAMSMIGIYSI